MTLSSASTLAEIQAQYVDNADYASAGSTSKAALFAQACRILVLKLPVQSSKGRHSMQLNAAGVQAELKTAEKWLAQKNSAAGGRIVHHSFENFRG